MYIKLSTFLKEEGVFETGNFLFRGLWSDMQFDLCGSNANMSIIFFCRTLSLAFLLRKTREQIQVQSLADLLLGYRSGGI